MPGGIITNEGAARATGCPAVSRVLPVDVAAEIAEVAERADAELAAYQASKARLRELFVAMLAEHYTLDAIGQAARLTRQRVHQIVHSR